MLRDDLAETHWAIGRAVAIAAGRIQIDEKEFQPDGESLVCPFVRNGVGATSGDLFLHLSGVMEAYPIPALPFIARKGELFLDVGCNWGRWVAAAGRAGFRCVGLDPSVEALVAAQEVFRVLGVHAGLVAGDARCLPLATASFDVTFSYSVLQHFAKDQADLAMREMGRVLQNGGRAWIQMPNAYGVRSLWHQARRGFRAARSFEVRYWTPGRLRTTFREAIGPPTLEVDGFLGLGVGAAETSIDGFRRSGRLVVRASRALKTLSRHVRCLALAADSLYVRGEKATK